MHSRSDACNMSQQRQTTENSESARVSNLELTIVVPQQDGLSFKQMFFGAWHCKMYVIRTAAKLLESKCHQMFILGRVA